MSNNITAQSDAMKFSYYLPDADGNPEKKETNAQSLVIIGANGAGKSRLGTWMEEHNTLYTHRINAQRQLNFKTRLKPMTYQSALDYLRFGTDDESYTSKANKYNRFHDISNYEKRPAFDNQTVYLINDIEYALAAVLALDHKESTAFTRQAQEAQKNGLPPPPVIKTVRNQLEEIWSAVLPHLILKIDNDYNFTVQPVKEADPSKAYNANIMSDGERGVLYYICQVLALPADQNFTLIIDEPELHLHRSIVDRLWDELEKQRQNFFFIYITHDTEFAASRVNAEKLWVRSYKETPSTKKSNETIKHWDITPLSHTEDFPEKLLYEILGSRKNVLFVEGDTNSYDIKLYRELYPNYHVVSCGSCTAVKEMTQSFNKAATMHRLKAYGLIDRDYLSENELASLRKKHIYALNVAEVENIFITEKLIKLLAKQFGEKEDEVFEKIKNEIINCKFKNELSSQIKKAVIAHLKYRTAGIDFSSVNEEKEGNSSDKDNGDKDCSNPPKDIADQMKIAFKNGIKSINPTEITNEIRKRFQKILDDDDYPGVLRVFNSKNLVNSVGKHLRINNQAYCTKVLNLLQGDMHDQIIEAIADVLPKELLQDPDIAEGASPDTIPANNNNAG